MRRVVMLGAVTVLLLAQKPDVYMADLLYAVNAHAKASLELAKTKLADCTPATQSVCNNIAQLIELQARKSFLEGARWVSSRVAADKEKQ